MHRVSKTHIPPAATKTCYEMYKYKNMYTVSCKNLHLLSKRTMFDNVVLIGKKY